MNAAERRVATIVRDAFRNVTLGEGTGLWEAQELDDYADQRQLAEYRARDEKANWSAIPPDDLNRCYSSLSFFDAPGMRFHLPAFLIADLEGLYSQDVIFHLTYPQRENLTRFDLLNASQRNAVREFLRLRLAASEFETGMIESALETYWNQE